MDFVLYISKEVYKFQAHGTFTKAVLCKLN